MIDYLPILVMAVLVVAFVMLSFVASQLLAPRRANAAKQAPYECGIVPEGDEKAERFPVKFYLVAMSFIVLDVRSCSSTRSRSCSARWGCSGSSR